MPSVLVRNNVHECGEETARPIVFSHGFGCDQTMWRFITPFFEDGYRVILFDHVGFGSSDLRAWDADRHGTLQGYADDLLQLVRAMDLTGVVFVGHSAASMIGVLAAVTDPSRFAQLVLVCPSPRYLDDADSGYIGGFSEEDINGLIGSLAANQREWADAMAPVIMGNADRPELAAELHASLCRTDPKVAAAFATATFRSDQRAELPKLTVPTVIVQTTEDAIAPQTVGQYTHDHIPDSTLLTINAVGHCPHFSAPLATADAIGRALPR